MSFAPRSARFASTEIVTLQFARGMAASLVVLVHLAERLVKRGVLDAGLDDPIWSLGYVGVATFFVISGFIMVHTTWDRSQRKAVAAVFLLRRLIRIAPLYYLTTICSIIFGYATQEYSTGINYNLPDYVQVVKALLFIPYVNSKGLLMPVYELGWTLEYEMFFYVLFAGGLILKRQRGLPVVMAILLSLVAAGRLVQPVTVTASTLDVIAWFCTRPILLYFVSGMLLATLLRWRGPFSIGVPAPVLVALAAGAVLVAGTTNSVPSVVPAAFAVGITGLMTQRQQSGAFANVCRFLGDASYSVYLTHTFLLGAIALVAAHAPVQRSLAVILAAVAAAVICFLAGWCVWRFVEVPIATFFKRWALTQP